MSNGAGNRTYVAEYIISGGEANTDVVKSVTIAGDTTGTWAADTSNGIEVRWGLMTGSTWQQTAGSWGTVNAVGSSNQFNFMGTNGNVFELFDVGLYEGPVAPAFQVPDYVSELALCQRYFFRRVAQTAVDFIGPATVYAAGGVYGANIPLPVPMRALATVTVSSPAHFNPFTSGGGAAAAFTSVTAVCRDNNSIMVSDMSGSSGLTAGNGTVISMNTSGSWIQANARL